METKNVLSRKLENFAVLVFTLCFSIIAFAQEATTPDVDITTTSTTTSSEEWFANPIYWVIGALLLIILIAVVARGNKRTD